ncbi:hypothetical protein Bbelb_318960 [Branchiostoma belcheri]|nr:hypothetical protein Bbelb_318960 [Branchiostoma belcheri]
MTQSGVNVPSGTGHINGYRGDFHTSLSRDIYISCGCAVIHAQRVRAAGLPDLPQGRRRNADQQADGDRLSDYSEYTSNLRGGPPQGDIAMIFFVCFEGPEDGVEATLRRLKRICQNPQIHLHPARLQTALNRVVKAAKDATSFARTILSQRCFEEAVGIMKKWLQERTRDGKPVLQMGLLFVPAKEVAFPTDADAKKLDCHALQSATLPLWEFYEVKHGYEQGRIPDFAEGRKGMEFPSRKYLTAMITYYMKKFGDSSGPNSQNVHLPQCVRKAIRFHFPDFNSGALAEIMRIEIANMGLRLSLKAEQALVPTPPYEFLTRFETVVSLRQNNADEIARKIRTLTGELPEEAEATKVEMTVKITEVKELMGSAQDTTTTEMMKALLDTQPDHSRLQQDIPTDRDLQKDVKGELARPHAKVSMDGGTARARRKTDSRPVSEPERTGAGTGQDGPLTRPRKRRVPAALIYFGPGRSHTGAEGTLHVALGKVFVARPGLTKDTTSKKQQTTYGCDIQQTHYQLDQPPLSQRHSPRSLGFQEAGQL